MKMTNGIKVVQRITTHGRGAIEIGECAQLGVYPSSGFKRGEFYLEARNSKARIIIGENVIINNYCTIMQIKAPSRLAMIH